MLKICVYETFDGVVEDIKRVKFKDVADRLKAAGLHPEEKQKKYITSDYGHDYEVTLYSLVVPMREWLRARRNIHYMFYPSRPWIPIRLAILTGVFLLTIIFSIWSLFDFRESQNRKSQGHIIGDM